MHLKNEFFFSSVQFQLHSWMSEHNILKIYATVIF